MGGRLRPTSQVEGHSWLFGVHEAELKAAADKAAAAVTAAKKGSGKPPSTAGSAAATPEHEHARKQPPARPVSLNYRSFAFRLVPKLK